MYKLKIAYLTDSDLRPERPILPEQDDADMYIRAFVEDISMFSSVLSAELVDDSILIELNDPTEIEAFHSSLKSTDSKYYENFKVLGLSTAK
ncbi:hypothetical protein [Vibrio jasicida]|uniref:hypothetical protein n=1 Tax=Vibrio jasicida TaxID=766224 RepID=UPI00164225C9|nr:hypothetical protein [Vibrio jasicida]